MNSAADRAEAGAGAPGAAGAAGGGRSWGKLVTVRLSDEDREKVSKAIAAGEANSNGEIVAVATPISDPYHDVALHWAVAAMILVLAWAAWGPDWLSWWYDTLTGGWHAEPTLGELLTF